MAVANTSFQISTSEIIRQHLSEKGVFKLLPPLFLLVKNGEIKILTDSENRIGSSTISIYAKEEVLEVSGLSEDCECVLIQYDRSYIRTMTLKLDLLEAFKYVYANSQPSFLLSKKDFYDLWILVRLIKRQLDGSQNSNIENHIFRHLNYSFLYIAIEKMNQTFAFQSKPRTQQEKLVLCFLKNLRENGTSKLKVSDYAAMQHVTTRHLSATMKQITGMSALDIIHRLLYSRAKSDLTGTDKPISEIAFNLGYNDPYTFSHFFKKQSGISPSDFRNKYQG